MASNAKRMALNMLRGMVGGKKMPETKKHNALMDMVKKARKSKKSTKTNPYRIDDKSDIMKALRGK